MKLGLFLIFMAFGFVASAEVDCVRRCERRAYNGRCVQLAPDFCGRGEAISCVPHCVQRNFQGRCTNYTRDFCGNYAECVPQCGQPSVTGHCMRWNPDACFADGITPYPY